MKYFIFLILALSPLPFASAAPIWNWLWVCIIGFAMIQSIIVTKGQLLEELSRVPYFSLLLLFVLWSPIQAFIAFDNSLFPHFRLDRISSAPYSTISVGVYFLAHICLFGSTFYFCKNRPLAIKLIRFCGLTSAFYALYGLIVYFSGNEKILWYPKVYNLSALTSTFVNPNNFATYIGLGLHCQIGYAWYVFHKASMGTQNGNIKFTIEFFYTKLWLHVTLILVSATALVLTSSRAGIASTFTALIVLYILILLHNNYKNKLIVKITSSLTLATIALTILSLSGSRLEDRLATAQRHDPRLEIYKLTLEGIKDSPLLGTGLGTFETAFPALRSPEINKTVVRGHNEYLELMLTSGIPTTIVLLGTILLLLTVLIRNLKEKSPPHFIVLLGITTTLQIGLHALVDFPMQIPAISYTWTVLFAASLAVAEKSKQTLANADTSNIQT